MSTENTLQITVDNIKCEGCKNTIETALKKIHGVTNCTIDVTNGLINIEGHADRSRIVNVLASLGYPERGAENTLLMKAKSYVSCAIGKVKNQRQK
jgi:copper chaperone CopZ